MILSVMHVLVTGGTGAVGREVVKDLRAAGHRARVLSRKPGEGEDWVRGDVATGQGLELAVKDVDAIIHAASDAANPRRYQATDVLGTRRLLAMAREAGVGHAVYVSIVGMEGVARDGGYVFVNGELWQAHAEDDSELAPGEDVEVTSVHGLQLTVRR